jgi:hypothetical protein
MGGLSGKPGVKEGVSTGKDKSKKTRVKRQKIKVKMQKAKCKSLIYSY